MRNKQLGEEELVQALAVCRTEGKRIALCHGVFDLLHPGHIAHFEEARELADVLVVSLTHDAHVTKGPGRPIFPLATRMKSVAALECVDFVVASHHPTAVEIIQLVQPHLYVKGPDYRNREADASGGIFLEEAAVSQGGGRLIFTNGEKLSSTELINQIFP